MSSVGCGIPVGNGTYVCGTYIEGAHAIYGPLLCPACQAGRAMLASVGLPLTASERSTLREAMIADGYCEGCLDARATSTHPNLCGPCRADFDRDLATEDVIEGNPGSRCTSACGPCGRCG